MADLLIGKVAANDGSGATLCAAELGRGEMVRCLVGHGAGVNVMTIRKADMPPNEAEQGTAPHKATFGGHMDIVLFLLDCGAQIDLKDPFGRTHLMRAEEAGYHVISELLKKRGGVYVKYTCE